MPSPHFNTIPAPPGIGPDDDIYRNLSRYLDGPFLKMYYDWAMEMAKDPSRKDRWKKGDNINYDAWRSGARSRMIDTMLHPEK